MPEDRNYNSISPSAQALLMMKAFTNIPFAGRAAELLVTPEKYHPDLSNKEFGFWLRVVHFENRYWSIDQLLSDLSVTNILELSSGFSFRGFTITQEKKVHYIDTDLPEIIALKTIFLQELQKDGAAPKGKLETTALNALDAAAFKNLVAHFPAGEIAIVNEGLLMYLDMDEKEKLCHTIHEILSERGGCWITADIYIRHPDAGINRHLKEKERQFLEQHRVEENKFESLEAAKKFFAKMGFAVDRIAHIDPSQLSSLKHLKKSMGAEAFEKLAGKEKIHYTWRLKVASRK
jgi:O-methyltransferase involved in polyketide biosynthesis